MVEPPRPRLSGRAPTVLGLAILCAALLAFGIALVALNVLPNPLSSEPVAVPTPTPGPSKLPKSARFAKQGDCVINRGTADRPEMLMVTCASESLEVLERLEGTVDVKECEKIKGYQFHYFYDSELGDKFDFVLCMRKRAG